MRKARSGRPQDLFGPNEGTAIQIGDSMRVYGKTKLRTALVFGGESKQTSPGDATRCPYTVATRDVYSTSCTRTYSVGRT